MKTDIITISADLKGQKEAMQAAQKFAAYHDLNSRGEMHLRLLTEETISMVHGILDDFSGDFWLESEKTKKGLLCRVCLSAEKQANKEQEEKILSVASTGKNESAKGIMGKIREVLRRSLQTVSVEDAVLLQCMNDALIGLTPGGNGFAAADSNYWSLQAYRQNITQKDAPEEWDELEKSIIANIADDVKVWLRNDRTEIVIEKLFPDA